MMKNIFFDKILSGVAALGTMKTMTNWVFLSSFATQVLPKICKLWSYSNARMFIERVLIVFVILGFFQASKK